MSTTGFTGDEAFEFGNSVSDAEARQLAMLLGVPQTTLDARPGAAATALWEWLDRHGRLGELPAALRLVKHDEPGTSWEGGDVAQTADVVILTPLADEFDAVRAAMRGGKPDTWGSRTIHRGEIAGQRVVVVPILGMGNGRATLAARDAVAVWNPSRLLLVGIAGGVPEGSDDMRLGDVLIPTEVVGYELAKVKPGRIDRRWDVFKPDHDLLLVAQQVQPAEWVHTIGASRPDGTGGRVIPRVHVGPVLSGDKVLAENAAVTDLRQHWPKAVGVEMEAVGVALVAYTGGPAFLMIRAASDFADEDKNDDWRRYAAAAAAEFALAVLRRAAR